MPTTGRITMLINMLRTVLDALSAELAGEGEAPPPPSLQQVPPPPVALHSPAPPAPVGLPVAPSTAAFIPPVGPPPAIQNVVFPPPVGPPPAPLAQPAPPPPSEARPPQRRRPLPAPPVGADQTGLGLSRLPQTLQRVISRCATSVLRSHRDRESPLLLDADSSAAFLDVASYVLSRPNVASATPALSEVDVWLVLRTSNKRGVARFHFSIGAGEPADFAARAMARVRAAHRPAAPSTGAEYLSSDEDESDMYLQHDVRPQGWSSAASSTAERNVRPRRA